MDLTEAVARYRTDGFVVWPGLVDRRAVAAARRHLAGRAQAMRLAPGDGMAGPAGPGSEMGRSIITCPLSGDQVAGDPLSGDDRLVRLASALLSGPAVVFGVTYLVKAPAGGPASLWHQDGEPWARQGITEAVTVWVALDRADSGTGGLVVVPGSHRQGPPRALVAADGPNMFGVKSAEAVDARSSVRLDMAPGDVSAHHPALLHRSPPNRSARVRRAAALRYRPAGTARPPEPSG